MSMRVPLVALLCIFWTLSSAQAALDSVSGVPQNTELSEVREEDDPARVAYSLANGFPIWYQDDNGLKLQLCIDQAVQKSEVSGGGTFFPCFLENPFAGPVSFPNNFGPEAFWYASNAATVFDSRLDGNVIPQAGDMLYRGDLEAAFGLDLGAFDGDQIAFGRIRLRISVPVRGIYEVTHPYGTFTYRLEDVGRRVINQTQDIGNKPGPSGPPPVGGDFTLALEDGVAPFGGNAPPTGFDFSENAEIVDEDGRSIGPFLLPADEPGGDLLPLIESVAGDLYLFDPGTEAIRLVGPVTGSPTGDNFFQLRLIALLEDDGNGTLVEVDPATRDFFLNAADDSQIVRVDDFQIMGKRFLDLPNQPPVADPVFVATAPGRTVTVDVRDFVRDDFIEGVNEYGIKLPLQAIGLPTDPDDLTAEIRLTRPHTTDEEGRVQRFTTVSTGTSVFRYTPDADFVGLDTFHYVVQDEGGLISAPAQVTVLVEEVTIDRAEYRPRTGKWRIEGTSSFATENTMTLHGAPRASLSGLTAAEGRIALFPREDALEYQLDIDPLPVTAVQRVHVRLGTPEEPGPVIFELFFSGIHGPFTGSRRAVVTGHVPQPAFGINSFAEAVEAILAGNTHINVITAANPGGEIRGEIVVPEIGTAPVDPQGRWVFEGKSTASPGALPNVSAESINGIRFPGAPLRIR